LAGLETASTGLIEVELPSGVKLRISGDSTTVTLSDNKFG
jgi:hypothetical protein